MTTSSCTTQICRLRNVKYSILPQIPLKIQALYFSWHSRMPQKNCGSYVSVLVNVKCFPEETDFSKVPLKITICQSLLLQYLLLQTNLRTFNILQTISLTISRTTFWLIKNGKYHSYRRKRFKTKFNITTVINVLLTRYVNV